MIFVAVGTQKFQFNRLLKAVDGLIAQGKLEDTVFAQTGHSDYIPRNYDYKDFLSAEDFHSCISSCDLLITHSGVATIMAGVKQEKPVVVIPRLARFGEHVDDHQLQIAASFSDSNLVLLCEDPDSLAQCIEEAKTHRFSRYVSQREQVCNTIREYLKTL